MAPSEETTTPDSSQAYVPGSESTAVAQKSTSATDRPRTPTVERDAGANGPTGAPNGEQKPPLTPSKSAATRAPNAPTPRARKKLPWKGKNIMVLIPKDEDRGLPGKPPIPLTESDVVGMLRSWQQLGYDIDGFDLYEPAEALGPREQSQSRGTWPDPDDMVKEREQRDWKVLLPDLNAWKKYVDELNEAKLRALGVSFGHEPPPPPSISPASLTQYPPLPFSPPVPTSSASSNQGVPGFPFTNAFGTSATQSPGIPAGSSPGPFAVKFNPRASISTSSPHAWSPQLMLQQGHRVGSPSLANLSAIVSPGSPFSADGMPGPVGHQRHQSLQFSTLPHQFQPPVKASPRLQDLREVEEEGPSQNPSDKPELGFVRHNASDSLQREIDEAEYHLEEQMRSQLENDEDYSPHNQSDRVESNTMTATTMTASLAQPSESLVQFAPQPPRFGSDANGLVLHHPRPHSRGHSLSQRYFTEDDASKEGSFRPTLQQINAQPAEDSEIETNPSNLGTPVQALDFSQLLQGSFTTASNPWTNSQSSKPSADSDQPRPGHGSKPSLSKLNVAAPEFKFNPASTSTFKPGPLAFSGHAFEPMAFNMGLSSTNLNQSSLPTAGSSTIKANAPVFAPSQSDFSFSTAGPKFRPDAPAFTPHSLPPSIASPVSGAENSSSRGGSIFGNIDLSSADIIKPAKKSKAIPIVRPESRPSPAPSGPQDGPDGRLIDESRVKRARAKADDDDAVPRFAESPKEDTPVPETRSEKPTKEDAVPPEEKSFDECNLGVADITLSSTMVSETTDTKATASPSETSPDHATANWKPFEFESTAEMRAFNEAVPFGSDPFKHGHKKTLSATAKAFVPGATAWAGTTEQATDAATDELTDQPASQSGAALNKEATTRDKVKLAEEEPQAADPASKEEESIEKPMEKPLEDPMTSPLQAALAQPADPPASKSPVTAGKGLSASRYSSGSPSPAQTAPKRTGLAASRFAAPPSPVHDDKVLEAQPAISPPKHDDAGPAASHAAESSSMVSGDEHVEPALPGEPTLADIDEVMRRLNENPDMGVNKKYDSHPPWNQPEPTGHSALIARTDEVSRPMSSAGLEDPFVDPSHSAPSVEGAVHRLNGSESLPTSDWDGTFTDDEQAKLESRVSFFDGRVNELVGSLLAARLGPLEQTLSSINDALATISRRTPSSRRERRSVSLDIPESDADDEDDEAPVALRSMSPRRDRRLEQIRAIVLDALAIQQRSQPKEAASAPALLPGDNSVILKALEEMREQLTSFRGENFKGIIEEVVERHIPAVPQPVVPGRDDEKLSELQARIAELEQRLRTEESKVEIEVSARRTAENRMAEIDRELQSAATRIEVEMMNKSALNQRIVDLEDRVHHAEQQAEEEVKGRRAAEDRLSEVQRLLQTSSEEETRLRELVNEKDRQIKSVESAQSKTAMRLSLLEASQANAQQSQSETQNRINALETDAREARKETQHWRSEADRIAEIARRRDRDLAQALDENKALHKLIDTLGVQLQENERVRDSWRSKFISLQEEMAQAARQVAEENARRTKKEQALLARQEVLDARLQAEARTRERIETELERLEMGERQGMRAVAECKRLEAVLAEMRTENHKLHQSALRYQAEFQEARESAAREVQRTRDAMQAEVDHANHQVNVVREELEDQMARLRAQLDQVKMDADTARARLEMLLEEAQNSKQAELQELERKHQNEVEDLQARYERQLSNTTEDAQRAEQNLLERLSISTSKTEHLQDKVAHLEEKLEIAKEAARAAAQAAKSAAGSEATAPRSRAGTAARQLEPPEKISPQALRESIMVLQEQLREREQRIEELELKLSKMDPDAQTKISKRDDEIVWLRELLAVRHSDLQDIISALGREDFDRNAVKDAAIRLKANLQMEEQERERAMNGGSAINLPNIAATIRDAATPRVAQAVGPLAAAWGNWRKTREGLGSVLSSPAPVSGQNSTPSRSSPAQGSFLGGLLTPPASSLRQAPPVSQAGQPTAFSGTGRRFTAQDLANRPRPPASSSSPAANSEEGKVAAVRAAPPLRPAPLSGPVTPPMMRPSSFDLDAQAEEFDDAGFFDD
ncbi:hypothetical protein VTK56DRAFT_2657 [Thermocarpiscus australiensis]